jgi:hypothetical protein
MVSAGGLLSFNAAPAFNLAKWCLRHRATLLFPHFVPLPRYMTYGEQEWREATESCLRNMELYDDNGEAALSIDTIFSTRHLAALAVCNNQPSMRTSGLQRALLSSPHHLMNAVHLRAAQLGISLSTPSAGSTSGPARALLALAHGEKKPDPAPVHGQHQQLLFGANPALQSPTPPQCRLFCRLPWDPVYLIESLSDSTIYMAYYAGERGRCRAWGDHRRKGLRMGRGVSMHVPLALGQGRFHARTACA